MKLRVLGGNLLQRLGAATADRYLHARIGQFERNGTADARGAAGHQRMGERNLHHTFPVICSWRSARR
jgi:hypothetical protein